MAAMTRPSWRRSLIALLALVGVSSLFFIAGRNGQSVVRVSAEQVTRGGLTSPLYNVPGFGRSIDDAKAFDRILLYESFQRGKLVRTCMARAGHEYQITDIFPANVVAQIALDMGIGPVEPSTGDLLDIDQLPNLERDSYYLALWGVTFSEAHRDDQQDPRPGEPKKGCYAMVDSSTPSVREIGQKFLPEMLEMKRAAARVADPAFARCVAAQGVKEPMDNPGAMERAVAASESQAKGDLARILELCATIRDAVYPQAHAEAATHLYNRHKAYFDAQISRYRGYEVLMAEDEEYASWLATELARLSAEYPDAAQHLDEYGKVAY